ncbi:MAG: RecX family transcriptional regulator [Proteobacteria bacterium]|nr:RecX family transcriptional regulator [Pseudomonadota bacterium]
MRRRRPRKPTPAYLERVALWYLERWFTTRHHLRRKLMERVERGLAEHGGDRDEVVASVDALLDRLERSQLLDDWRYVRGKVDALRRRGDSERAIRGKLAQKGAERDMVDRALAEHSDGGELLAACRYVRRRRLGPYRLPEKAETERQRDLARLARAGFSYGTAKQALGFERDEIDDRVFAAR